MNTLFKNDVKGGLLVNERQDTATTELLQRGIAAARAGRHDEAQQILQQVITSDPNSEMAWLWLSGLMTTNEGKQTCLKKVLLANPNNVFARAGLKRLQQEATTESGILELRLASVTNDNAPGPGAQTASSLTARSNGRDKPVTPEESLQFFAQAQTDARATHEPSSLDEPGSFGESDLSGTTCPACDMPISADASRCLYCFVSFDAIEEPPATNNQPSRSVTTQPFKPQRKGILGLFGDLIST